MVILEPGIPLALAAIPPVNILTGRAGSVNIPVKIGKIQPKGTRSYRVL
jgi:hypothetical protein